MATVMPQPMDKLPTFRKSLRALLGAVAPEVVVSDITLDSRAVTPGAMFLAVPGRKQHGLQFVAQAMANGARAIAYEPAPDTMPPAIDSSVPVLAVPDLRTRLGAIADFFFDRPSAQMSVVGVTGTNGKTTTAYLIAAAFDRLQRTAGYMGTLGFGPIYALRDSSHTTADCITVHRQLAMLRANGARHVGMEVSSHALDQGRIDGVRIHTAVFTNLTRDHLDYHGSFEAYGAAKERLFHRDEVKCCIVNADDVFGSELLARLLKRQDRLVIAYGCKAPALGDQQLFATQIERIHEGMRIVLDGSFGRGTLETRLIGAFNVENLLAALGALLSLEVPLTAAITALAQCPAPPGRMEVICAPGRPRVVVDYAHTPDALAKALQTARQHTRGKLFCVFGCGGDRDAGKRPLMGDIAERSADVVILTDDNPRLEDPNAIIADILQGCRQPQTVIVERDRATAIARAIALAGTEDLVLIAGKGHERHQIIGRDVQRFSDQDAVRRSLGLPPC